MKERRKILIDKLKYVKLENPDGSYSASIPLSVNGAYVDIDGNTLIDELNNKADKESTNISIDNLQTEVERLGNGAPLVASSVAGMTNTNKIYVNTTDGHWYWYDGSSWQDGGVYQSAEDSSTLTVLVNEVNNGTIYNNSINLGKLTDCILDKSIYETLAGTIETGYFINKNTHIKNSFSQGCIGTFDVHDLECILITCKTSGNAETYSFWDGNDNYIDGSSYTLSGDNNNLRVLIPKGAYYIKVSSIYSNNITAKKYEILNNGIDVNDTILVTSCIKDHMGYKGQDLIFEVGFVTTDGRIDTTYSYIHNAKINCKYKDKIKFSTNASGSGLYGVGYYDVNDVNIGLAYKNAGIIEDEEIIIPYPNCAYIRISTTDKSITSVYKYDFIEEKDEIMFNSLYKSAINQRLHKLSKGGLVITVDDGDVNNVTNVFPLITTYDIPITFGCWTNSYIILNNLQALLGYIEDYNCEIAQHTAGPYVDKTIKDSYSKLKKEKENFANLGVTVENYIYGYNQTDDNLMYSASALYDYACSGSGHTNNESYYKYNLSRVWITWANTNSFKTMIDRCIENKELLIIGIHASELNDSDTMQKLIDVITYAKNSDITITNMKGIKNL